MKNTPDLFTLAEHSDLIQKLKAWDIAYHQNDAPVVDDATYDAAKYRALEIEEMYPEHIHMLIKIRLMSARGSRLKGRLNRN